MRLYDSSGVSLDPHGPYWTPVWTAAPVALDAQPLLAEGNTRTLDRSTVRQTLRLTLAASKLRLTVSNLFGSTPLHFSAVTVAKAAPKKDGETAGSPGIVLDTIRAVTFGGSPRLDLPPKSTVLTDAITLPLVKGDDLTVSIYIERGQRGREISGHQVSKADTWLQGGNCAFDAELSEGRSVEHWLWLTQVEALLPGPCTIVSCFGDSITDRGDGGMPFNKYQGWTDGLSVRLDAAARSRQTAPFTVLNLGISGDQLCAGGLARFDRDVLHPLRSLVPPSQHQWAPRSRPRHILIIHMGVNDIGVTPADETHQDELYHRLVSAYRQVSRAAHDHGLLVIGSTIMPFLPPADWPTPWPFAHPRREETRLKVNRWIRAASDFDHVVDFSAAVTDPQHPHRLQQQYQLTDYLHPSVEGCQAMADAINLEYLL